MEQLLEVRRPGQRRGRQLEVLVRWMGRDTGRWERGQGDWERWEDSWQPIGDLVGKLKKEARRMERERYAGGGPAAVQAKAQTARRQRAVRVRKSWGTARQAAVARVREVEGRLVSMARRAAARKRRRPEDDWVQQSDAERQRRWETLHGEPRPKRRIERTCDARKRRRRESMESDWAWWLANGESGGSCGPAPTWGAA